MPWDFVLEMMNCALKMVHFALEMMDFGVSSREAYKEDVRVVKDVNR